MQPVTVSGGPAAKREPPAPNTTVTEKDFTFTVPAQVAAGHQTWKVYNNGKQPHEMDLVKLAPGKMVDDLKAYFAEEEPSDPPPGDEAGGLDVISMGNTVWADFDLQPGNYVLLCHLPDPATGKSHLELGMATAFTVTAQ